MRPGGFVSYSTRRMTFVEAAQNLWLHLGASGAIAGSEQAATTFG